MPDIFCVFPWGHENQACQTSRRASTTAIPSGTTLLEASQGSQSSCNSQLSFLAPTTSTLSLSAPQKIGKIGRRIWARGCFWEQLFLMIPIWGWVKTYNNYHSWGHEYPVTSYFSVHKGTRGLTHGQIRGKRLTSKPIATIGYFPVTHIQKIGTPKI